MARETHRRRRPDSVHRGRPTEEVNSSRLIPIPKTLKAGADTWAAATRLREFDILQYVLDHLGDGDVEKVYHETEPGDNGFKVDAKINGKWYHLHIIILPQGGACA